MNAAQAITAGMRAQRRRDFARFYRTLTPPLMHVFAAWLMWGWDINGHGGLGQPGGSWPYGSPEPRWMR